MKRLMRLLVLPFALSLAFSPMALALDAWDEGAFWEDDDYGVFESDNWADDDFGYYDEDFDYDVIDTDEDAYTDWYEDPHSDWMGYDDVGEEGFFDI